MKPLPSRRSIRARRHNLLRETTREIAALADQPDYYYREPWQRVPVDPSVPHSVTLETRPTFPDTRALCTCGFDSGWLPRWDAEQRTAWHRREAEKLHAPGSDRAGDRGLHVPLPILDEQQPILLVFDPRDLAIEFAYERSPIPGGTRVRTVPTITTEYWIPRATPVFAIGEGVVLYAAKHAAGYTIAIDHEDGWITVYHRLEHAAVAAGARLAAGGVLGHLAASRSGPLKPLRFEMWRWDGEDEYEQMDPLRYIRRWRHLDA